VTIASKSNIQNGFSLFRSLRFGLLKHREVRDLLLCILHLKTCYFFSKFRYMKAHAGMSFFYLLLKFRNWLILGLGYVLRAIGHATGLFHVEISRPNVRDDVRPEARSAFRHRCRSHRWAFAAPTDCYWLVTFSHTKTPTVGFPSIRINGVFIVRLPSFNSRNRFCNEPDQFGYAAASRVCTT